MRERRLNRRYKRRLDTEFRHGDVVCKGISTNVSARGLFIRTQQPFVVGTVVDIRITLSNDTSCAVKGIVRYARRVMQFDHDNGMGIEVTEWDENFMDYVRALKY